nr:MAG TPA: hypothetical protein [Caudoviricetes sp.]
MLQYQCCKIGLFIQKHQEPFKLGSWCFYCLHIVCN